MNTYKAYKTLKKAFKNESGLTLLEVMISMIVLSIGFLGLAPMVVLSIEGNNISRDVLNVSGIAKQQIEIYKGMPTLPAAPFTQVTTNPTDGYTVTTYLNDNISDNTVPVGLKRIDIIIDWTGNQGVGRTISYSTFLEE
ncbi:MAG: prepilin-type N-terminal cleavage/methylation domain-containing protein [candidate division Zixibacteria bacterium]|nr:prepilin-type N-terminal cleavage/methylation domain-containing protein [candidate division Zixibacteria bacterium]